MQSYARKAGIDFTGTADHVAGMMQEIMEEVGGDGFLIFNSYFDRRYVMEVCDGLVPELQRRGLTRKAYAHKHLARQSAGVLIAPGQSRSALLQRHTQVCEQVDAAGLDEVEGTFVVPGAAAPGIGDILGREQPRPGSQA